jgi:antirestriction protein
VSPEHGPSSPEQTPGRERQPEFDPRIYVASLSDYNAGRLHGEWIDAAQDPEAIHAAISAMLARSKEPLAEEWVIHDHDNFGPLRLGEWESIEHVSLIGQGIAEHGQAFAAWAALTDQAEWDDKLGQFDEVFLGEWSSPRDYADSMLEDLGIDLDEIGPEFIRPYLSIDLDAFARDLSHDLYFEDAPNGNVYVFQPQP